MTNLPHTTEEQLQKLAKEPNINQTWLRLEAERMGIDTDYRYGFDDEFSNKEYDDA